jgi:hypothetical protein
MSDSVERGHSAQPQFFEVSCFPVGGGEAITAPPIPTETRVMTELGWGGSMTCKRVPVTLAYSGTMQ